MRVFNLLSGGLAASASLLTAGLAMAQDAGTLVGKPVAGGMGFQPAGSELASDIHWLDGMITVIITAIVVFVLVLLLITAVRFNRRANPNPARFTHNTPLEVAWTIIPIVILVFIGSFSLPTLFKQQEFPVGEVVIKATGNQWYWSYAYPDEKIAFDSTLVDGSTKVDALGADQPMGEPLIHDEVADMKLKALGYTPDEFLLAVDNPIVVPVGKIVLVQITGSDVIHSWKVPSLGVMQDAVPGRTGQSWFKADKEGVFFGQCSELCGKNHAYMPIVVKVVNEQAYADWLVQAKTTFAADAAVEMPVQLAASN
jgi:cytochrome c oxidase subunit 2